jgi:organic radical activating enzyme
MSEIKLFDILENVKNAGPSPADNRRTELYFGGCKRAMEGNPCKGCFNPMIWDSSKCYPREVSEIVRLLDDKKLPKYITIVGGEPTDQMGALIDLTTRLKELGYHIMLFSWRSYDWVKSQMGESNLKNIDIVVTEPYQAEYRIYDNTLDDGLHNVIGSGNQEVWIPAKNIFYKAGDLASMTLNENNELEVTYKNE